MSEIGGNIQRENLYNSSQMKTENLETIQMIAKPLTTNWNKH